MPTSRLAAMTRHVMPPVEGYDLGTQPTVAFLAASLDDQLRRLREDVAGLDVEALEWQEAPGRNTIGMLLAHLAVAEAWWFHAGARGISEREGINEVLQGVIGMNPEDDGIPLAPDGGHPATLAGIIVILGQDYRLTCHFQGLFQSLLTMLTITIIFLWHGQGLLKHV